MELVGGLVFLSSSESHAACRATPSCCSPYALASGSPTLPNIVFQTCSIGCKSEDLDLQSMRWIPWFFKNCASCGTNLALWGRALTSMKMNDLFWLFCIWRNNGFRNCTPVCHSFHCSFWDHETRVRLPWAKQPQTINQPPPWRACSTVQAYTNLSPSRPQMLKPLPLLSIDSLLSSKIKIRPHCCCVHSLGLWAHLKRITLSSRMRGMHCTDLLASRTAL